MKKIATYNDKIVSIPNKVYEVIMKARSNENIRIDQEDIDSIRNKYGSKYKSVNIINLGDTYHDEIGYSIEEVDEDGDTIEIVYVLNK